MRGWFFSWYRVTPEERQNFRLYATLGAYCFLLQELFRDPGDFWFTLAMASVGGIALLQVVMRSDSHWFDRFGFLLGGLVALLGWWLTGAYTLAIVALLILPALVVDVALHRKHVP